MRASEHLFQLHKAAAAHHGAMVTAHEGALAKAKAKDMKDGEDDVKFHKAAMASHQQMADFHEGAMDECSKAISDSLNKANQIVPDRVTGIVRPVPRAGQRPIGDGEVPIEFDKMFAIED
jgi:hypothetical protein